MKKVIFMLTVMLSVALFTGCDNDVFIGKNECSCGKNGNSNGQCSCGNVCTCGNNNSGNCTCGNNGNGWNDNGNGNGNNNNGNGDNNGNDECNNGNHKFTFTPSGKYVSKNGDVLVARDMFEMTITVFNPVKGGVVYVKYWYTKDDSNYGNSWPTTNGQAWNQWPHPKNAEKNFPTSETATVYYIVNGKVLASTTLKLQYI